MKQGLQVLLIRTYLNASTLLNALFASIVFLQPLVCIADVDFNKLLTFKKIYLEKTQDNVEGAFGYIVKKAYLEILEINPRFELTHEESLSDTILRTQVEKKSTGIDLEISLVLTQTKELFSKDRTTIPVNFEEADIKRHVQELLKTSLRRIPFYGTITGRDGAQITLDIGSKQGLKKGDIVQISRIDQVRRHPLLKTIVDTQLVPVGSVAIEEVEEVISFGHIHDEIVGEKVEKLHKLTAIEARSQFPDAVTTHPKMRSQKERDALKEEGPELGYVGITPSLGSLANSTSQDDGATNFEGSGTHLAAQLQAELWLTKNWFADTSFSYGSVSYSQENARTNIKSSAYSTTTFSFNIHGGYKHWIDAEKYRGSSAERGSASNSMAGPHAYIKLGYSTFEWNTPSSSGDILSPKKYSGLDLGLGGGMPLGNLNWGALLSMNIFLFPSLKEGNVKTPSDGGILPSPAAMQFFIGGYYRFLTAIEIRGGAQIELYSATFKGATKNSSTSQTILKFGPGIIYYF